MKTWNPFIVKEIESTGSPSNKNTHVLVLRVKDCYDLEIFQGTEVECFKEAHEINYRLRVSLKDFVDGM
jgi:hypothetical protein